MSPTSATVAALMCLYLGYSLARLRHDGLRHHWQITWLIGRAGRHETRIRRLEEAAGVTPPDDDDQEPAHPTLHAALAADARRAWAGIRAAGCWLSRRAEPQPATPDHQPDDQPVTAPIPAVQPEAVDPWRSQFTFTGGRQP